MSNQRVYKFGPTCVVHNCTRPVAELGGYCLRHWQSLSPEQRATLQWSADNEHGDTETIDSLEVIYGLPAYGEAA